MALTGKKRVFADAVLAGKSNKDAAIAAGYSPATASAAGSRLVKDKQVAEYLSAHRVAAEKGEPPPDTGPKFDMSKVLLYTDPQKFLLAAMNDAELDPKQRIIAARALMPFMHPKIGEGGKKDQAKEAADKAVAGKFAPKGPPRLVVNNR